MLQETVKDQQNKLLTHNWQEYAILTSPETTQDLVVYDPDEDELSTVSEVVVDMEDEFRELGIIVDD